MSIPETLLAAVCLLVTCSGIAVMAEDWRDTASANRAAAEFTVTARRAAAWVLSRRADLAGKAEHAPFSLTELCPETSSARNSVTGQPYTAFLFTPETGRLSLALFAAGGSGDREMPRKIIRPAARRIEAGFFVAEDGLLVRGNEKLSPASLCSGCGSLSPQPCPPVPGEPSSPFPKAAPSPPCRQTASFPVSPYPEEKKRAWTRRSA